MELEIRRCWVTPPFHEKNPERESDLYFDRGVFISKNLSEVFGFL
jgi:hypothetical protein